MISGKPVYLTEGITIKGGGPFTLGDRLLKYINEDSPTTSRDLKLQLQRIYNQPFKITSIRSALSKLHKEGCIIKITSGVYAHKSFEAATLEQVILRILLATEIEQGIALKTIYRLVKTFSGVKTPKCAIIKAAKNLEARGALTVYTYYNRDLYLLTSETRKVMGVQKNATVKRHFLDAKGRKKLWQKSVAQWGL